MVAGSAEALGGDFARFLAEQRELQRRFSGNTSFPARRTQLVAAPTTRAYARADLPRGMVAIEASKLSMKIEFRTRECGFYEAQPSGGSLPALHREKVFEREVTIGPYAIDLTPVTNAQYAEFLKASGYRPAHSENFLKHWSGKDVPPGGLQDHPVVYVDLDDARAYAKWAGKRLPTEEEWQYAAQGQDGRRYPWGNQMQANMCNDGSSGSTTPVDGFPKGRSPFGCYDMCGNVWQWTESERSDGRTRFAILRGGCYFKAKGSEWYMDGGPQPCCFAAKCLLTWSGLDRCATVGFRCAADLA